MHCATVSLDLAAIKLVSFPSYCQPCLLNMYAATYQSDLPSIQFASGCPQCTEYNHSPGSIHLQAYNQRAKWHREWRGDDYSSWERWSSLRPVAIIYQNASYPSPHPSDTTNYWRWFADPTPLVPNSHPHRHFTTHFTSVVDEAKWVIQTAFLNIVDRRPAARHTDERINTDRNNNFWSLE